MKTFTVQEASDNLDTLLAEAHRGRIVVITARNGRAVRLVPAPVVAQKPRKAGSARGQVWMSDDFDDPLEDFSDYME